MIGQLNWAGKDKVETAIERLRTFEPPEGYYLAFSGGKDSVVIKALADMAGVKYDAHYNVTSVDPPELVRFVKSFSDVNFDIPHDADGKPVTMWNLIARKLMPPTRVVRYCCEALKEHAGNGRLTVTGVRWDESARRKNNQGGITIPDKSAAKEMEQAGVDFTKTIQGGVVLNLDNSENKRMVEFCYKKRKTLLNPIIDWTTDEVWEFIKTYKIPYCELYDEGFTRLGCIGCPMGGGKAQVRDFKRWPKYRTMYIKAFERMLKARKDKETQWKTGEEVLAWWTGEVNEQ